MEVVVGLVEVPPGAAGVLHTHPGEEAYPDGKPLSLAMGVANINVRDVPHGAFKVTQRQLASPRFAGVYQLRHSSRYLARPSLRLCP
jgi:hypothetical protein